jgi:excisionase family DNA binding protein
MANSLETAAGEQIAGPETTLGLNRSIPEHRRLSLSYGEAARAVGCSPRTIWSACASGDLRAARIGRRRVIAVDELRRWLDAKAGIAAPTALSASPKGGAR